MKRIALVVLAGCGSSAPKPEPLPAAPLPPEEGAPRTTGTMACVPAGFYKVTVDLTTAQITQVNTGMTDTEWCKSMLIAVPTAQMSAMRVGYENGVMSVRWPPSRSVAVSAKSDCELAIAEQPIPVDIKFAAGRGVGTSTYSMGTVNHPDEKCTATGATFTFERTGD